MKTLTLCLATHNPHKVRELSTLLFHAAPDLTDKVVLTSLAEQGIPDSVVEDGSSFAENAAIKANAAHEATGLWSLADDSGLEVDALDGAPGIFSARWAGEPRSDARNLDRLLDELKHVPDERRQARFVCVLCLVGRPTGDTTPQMVCREGTCCGQLRTSRAGVGGFGYDPLFVPTEEELAASHLPREWAHLTFAEFSAEQKNRLSHRARAVFALVPVLRRLVGQLSA